MGLFSSSSKTKTKVKPYDKTQYRGVIDELYGLGQNPFELYPDQMYAGQTPMQGEGLGMREQFARDSGVVNPALDAYRSQLQSPDVANNPYVQAMLGQQQNLLNRNLTENLLPTIDSQAIGMGQMGSSRQGVAEGIAMRGTQEALANAAANTQMGAYSEGLADRRAGTMSSGNMYGLGQMPGQTLYDIGSVQRGEEQLGIDEAMQRYNFAQEEPWMRAERMAGNYLGATNPYATKTTTSTSNPSIASQIGQVAGMALGGYGMGQSAGLWGGGGGSPVGGQGGTGYTGGTVGGINPGYANAMFNNQSYNGMAGQYMPQQQPNTYMAQLTGNGPWNNYGIN